MCRVPGEADRCGGGLQATLPICPLILTEKRTGNVLEWVRKNEDCFNKEIGLKKTKELREFRK